MAEAPVNLPRQLKTPRAAAIAGILFAVLAGTTQVLVRLSIPSDATETGAWLAGLWERWIIQALRATASTGMRFIGAPPSPSASTGRPSRSSSTPARRRL